MKKALELWKLCHASVYVVVKYHGQYHIYTSEKSRQWPPNARDIVGADAAIPRSSC